MLGMFSEQYIDSEHGPLDSYIIFNITPSTLILITGLPELQVIVTLLVSYIDRETT
jgi:hypothetical protein